MNDVRAKKVLDFWFGDLDQGPEYFRDRNKLWFGGAAETDAYIRREFEADVTRAAQGELASWTATPRGSLALIVLLDQFSLNLYREKPQSYDQSALALPIAEKLIREGLEWTLTPAERVFLYLPFEHAEDLATQERSVALFRELARPAPPALKEIMAFYADFAVRHHRVVKRYGRFPDRNAVFGRKSTAQELDFLSSDESPF